MEWVRVCCWLGALQVTFSQVLRCRMLLGSCEWDGAEL